MDREPKPEREDEMEKAFTLLDKEEMLHRLKKVNDDEHIQKNLFPILLRNAGTQIVPRGVVIMLMLAIHDYTEGMPAAVAALISVQVPAFIDALIPDPKAAEEAKKHWAEVNA